MTRTSVVANTGVAVALSLLAVCSIAADQTSTEVPRKAQVVDLLKSIETGDSAPVGYINPNKYIQHNLAVADGLAGFGAVLQALPKDSARVNTVRAFEDGDFVFTHTEYNFFGPKIGFDIFRFEDGLIVEHWDNLQETPANPNPSGRSMIDGSTVVTDIHKTAENKALVRAFVEDVLVAGKMDRLAGYFDGDNYIQHNPQIGDKLSGLGAALQGMAQQGITMKYDRIHMVLGEGNFVLITSEGRLAGKHSAFYDLFRVENGKIAEHWDTIETIPARDQWRNSNGKFRVNVVQAPVEWQGLSPDIRSEKRRDRYIFPATKNNRIRPVHLNWDVFAELPAFRRLCSNASQAAHRACTPGIHRRSARTGQARWLAMRAL